MEFEIKKSKMQKKKHRDKNCRLSNLCCPVNEPATAGRESWEDGQGGGLDKNWQF
jgi:hypothetical protein